MKKLSTLLILILVCTACKQEAKKVVETTSEEVKTVIKDRSSDFPTDIAAVFKAHGGIQAFDRMNTLIFEISKPDGNEKHTTDLKTRHARIETGKYALGFDGQEAWLKQDSTYFKGNPRFYHNLMFYFYAMPFVLGDQGITYEKTTPLKVGEQSYPGYKISYGDGIGDSPKPKTLKWRALKNGVAGEVKNEMNFVNASASQEQPAVTLFQKPADVK